MTRIALASLVLTGAAIGHADTMVQPIESVQTSAFFFAPDFVRGFAGDNRPVQRIADDQAFGVGPETIYLAFDANDFASLNAPVIATLSVQTATDAFATGLEPGDSFVASAHAVDTDPLVNITDNTSAGTINWLDFLNDNVVDAAPEAVTTIVSEGQVDFDVTSIVTDWLTGQSDQFFIALTGKDQPDNSGIFLGIANNTETPGSTILSIVEVPEPLAASLVVVGVCLLPARRLSVGR